MSRLHQLSPDGRVFGQYPACMLREVHGQNHGGVHEDVIHF